MTSVRTYAYYGLLLSVKYIRRWHVIFKIDQQSENERKSDFRPSMVGSIVMWFFLVTLFFIFAFFFKDAFYTFMLDTLPGANINRLHAFGCERSGLS